MTKNLRFLLSLLTVAIIVSSCGKKAPTEAKYIPKDAAYTIIVDALSLQEKMKKGNVGVDSIIAKMQQISGDTLSAKDKQMWEDFKNSGISQEDKVSIFILQKGSMKSGQTFVANFMTVLKDQSKFEAFLKKEDASKDKEVIKATNYSYIVMDNSSMISWNKEVVIATMFNKDTKPEYDSTGAYKPTDRNLYKIEMQKEVERFFTQKESESMASVGYFKDMFKEKADGYMFTTSAGSLAAMSAMPFNLPKLEELMKDNYGVATFNFEDGKVVLKGSSYTNPLLSSILKKYAGPTVNIGALEKFPSQNVNGVMLAAFNPELFDGVLKELEVGGMVDGFLSKEGITRADIFKALKGEINVAVGDFSISTAPKTVQMYDGSTYQTTQETPSAKLVFHATIGDKAAFAKLMDKAAENGAVVKAGNGYAAGPMLKMGNLFLHTDDKEIILASDSATYVAYAAGTTKATIDADVLSKLKGKSVASFVNINSILKGCMPSMKDGMGSKMLSIVNATFKDAFFTMDNFDGKSVKSEGEVRMADTKENSLVSMIKMGLNMGAEIKAEEKKWKQQAAADTTSPMPTTQEKK